MPIDRTGLSLPSVEDRVSVSHGVVLVAHGSLRAGSDTALHAVVEELNAAGNADRAASQSRPVVGCFLNYGEPLLEDGFANLARTGATNIRVQPYFLFGGQYTMQDLPQRLNDLDRRWQAVDSILGPVIAEHPAWTRAVVELAMSAIGRADSEQGCLFVVHGSRYEPAVGQVQRMTERLKEILEPIRVATAYLDIEEPDIPTAVCNLYDEGVRRLCVVPVLLSAGRHAREDVPRAIEAFKHRHPDCTVALTDHLGETNLLTPVLQDLIESAVAGDSDRGRARARYPGLAA